jgi:hypothetical protein
LWRFSRRDRYKGIKNNKLLRGRPGTGKEPGRKIEKKCPWMTAGTIKNAEQVYEFNGLEH